MKYSDDLIKEVKELFPNSREMRVLAERGGEMLGRYLDDSMSYGIPVDRIIAAKSLDELKQEAHLIKRKLALYKKWGEEWDAQRKKTA